MARSFVNVMPTDDRQAAALVAWMAECGAARPFLADDGEDYGADMRWLVHRALAASGRSVVGAVRINGADAGRPGGVVGGAGAGSPGGSLGGADAVFLGAALDERTMSLLIALHERAPDAPLFAMEGLLDDEFAAALPDEVAGRLHVTAGPARGDQLPAAGRALAGRLRARLGREPDPHAVYAYEATSVVLDALARAGADRAALAADLRATRGRDSVIGRYDIDEHGATTLASTGRLRVEHGRFVPS